MAFPAGWPPRRPNSSNRPLRFYVAGTATANFEDNAFLFIDDVGANPYTPLPVVQPGSSAVVNISSPMGTGTADYNRSDPNQTTAVSPKAAIWAGTIMVRNAGASPIEISFDGTIVQGQIAAGETRYYRNRAECGIAVRGAGMAFWVEAW